LGVAGAGLGKKKKKGGLLSTIMTPGITSRKKKSERNICTFRSTRLGGGLFARQLLAEGGTDCPGMRRGKKNRSIPPGKERKGGKIDSIFPGKGEGKKKRAIGPARRSGKKGGTKKQGSAQTGMKEKKGKRKKHLNEVAILSKASVEGGKRGDVPSIFREEKRKGRT